MIAFTWALRPCIRQAGIVSSSIRASRPPSYSVFRITRSCPVVTRHASSKSSTPPQNASPAAVENTNVDHSSFIAEASPQQEWKKENPAHKAIPDPAAEEQDAFNTITPGKGSSWRCTLTCHILNILQPSRKAIANILAPLQTHHPSRPPLRSARRRPFIDRQPRTAHRLPPPSHSASLTRSTSHCCIPRTCSTHHRLPLLEQEREERAMERRHRCLGLC
jgi:hypothetical protein